jgi:hypothetical protein
MRANGGDEDADDEHPQKELEEELLSSEELLRRARARLLEDLMMEGKLGDSVEAGTGGSASSEKGTGVALPHSFEKYREVRIGRVSAPLQRWFVVVAIVFFVVVVVFPPALSGSAIVVSIQLSLQIYNRGGRIGIYTPSERAAILSRFHHKRSRRVWNKKIRYSCRKNLADRRMRVKGRFVKRSEQEVLQLEQRRQLQEDENDEEYNQQTSIDVPMPDVNDPEAGFAPTKDQPYRRLRRHTVT